MKRGRTANGLGAGAAALAGICAFPYVADAQPVGILPSDPHRAVDPSPTPIPPKPDLGAVPVPAAPQAAAPGEAKFLIEAYDVAGNSLLDQAVIERTVYPFLGPGRTVADVDRARAALEAVYRARGYQTVYVAIPPQTGADNIVRLQVTEARVGQLRVTGAKYYSPRAVREQLPSLSPGEVPNLTQFQRELAALERTGPDRAVTPEIKPGTVPGTIDIDLQVKDSLPYHASVTLSNDHSANTKPLRVLANVRATNLWQLGHTVSFTYLVAPERRRDAEVYSGSYLAPIANSAWSLLLYGYKSNSNVALLGGATVLGNGYAIGARALLALSTTGRWSHSLNFGADYKDFIEDTNVPNAAVIRAPIQYIPAQITYSAQRAGDTSTLSTSASLIVGLRILDQQTFAGNSQDANGQPVPVYTPTFRNRREGARENFLHVNADVDWNRTFQDDTRLIARVAAQYSDQPLISNEQFSAGGISSVRGYLQSEAVGDDGVSGTLEALTPSIDKWVGRPLGDLRAFAFVDGGFVRNKKSLIQEANDFSLLSFGLGARARLFRFLSGEGLFGVPVFNGTATRTGDVNVQFDVKAEF